MPGYFPKGPYNNPILVSLYTQGSANQYSPTPPPPVCFYTDRNGNFYVDRNGNFYVPRACPVSYYEDRSGNFYVDRNGNSYIGRQ